MQKFRNLTKNIFFKIFLIFIAFTFVGFGMADLVLGNKNWIAKIGDDTITYDQYVKKLNQSSSAIYNSNPTQENLKLVKSNQFKVMVLQKIVAQTMIREIRNDFNFNLEKQILLNDIVKNEAFFDDSGNFNRQYFINFLQFNNLTEKSYLKKVQDDIFHKIINKSFQTSIKENDIFSKILYKNKAQSRIVDIIRFSEDNIKIKKKITQNDLKKFYKANKNLFFFPETREVSYIEFDQEEFAHQIKISDNEIAQKYEENIENFTIAEKRDFYHLIFDNKKDADSFEKEIKKTKLNDKNFLKIAKQIAKKEKDEILLEDISSHELIKNLRIKPFKLKRGEKTDIIKSDIGYHIFYLTKITPKRIQNLSEVKDQIKENIEQSKKIKHFTKIKKQIDESLILDNSLTKISNKFRLKIKKSTGQINKENKLDNFWKNAFKLKLNSPSKIFESKSNNKFYIIKVVNIINKKDKSYKEAKLAVKKLVNQKNQQEYVTKIISESNAKLIKNPKYFYKISRKENLKITNKEIKQDNNDFDKEFIKEIFNLKKIKTATSIKKYGKFYQVSFLKKIKNNFDENEFKTFKEQSKIVLDQEILEEYNQFLRKRYHIIYNQKILNSILGIEND